MFPPSEYATAFVTALQQRGRTYIPLQEDQTLWRLGLLEQEQWHMFSLDFQPETIDKACHSLARFVVEKNVVQFAIMRPTYPEFIQWGGVVDPNSQTAVVVVGPEHMRPSWRVDLLVRCETYLGFQFI